MKRVREVLYLAKPKTMPSPYVKLVRKRGYRLGDRSGGDDHEAAASPVGLNNIRAAAEEEGPGSSASHTAEVVRGTSDQPVSGSDSTPDHEPMPSLPGSKPKQRNLRPWLGYVAHHRPMFYSQRAELLGV